jgi:formylglycine-generating enzyme required for sulfatase activity
VTQKQWRLIMNTSPSYFRGDDLPVERITWLEADEFCRRLSEKENKRYRLPTQEECKDAGSLSPRSSSIWNSWVVQRLGR